VVTGCPPRPGKRPRFGDGPDVDDGAHVGHGGAFEGANWRAIAASAPRLFRPLCRQLFAAVCPVVRG
jgi:hypothetical protein